MHALRPGFCLWIVTPPGYVHSRCFEEVAQSLQASFAELGYDAPIVTEPGWVKGRAIVLGTNLLAHIPAPLPEGLILYNLEQVQQDSSWMTPEYRALLARYPVWDYSARNIARLAEYGITDKAVLCGIGYMPALTRIAPAAEDIDVLFIGSTNDRRVHILQQIANSGKQVQVGYGVYGTERDALIARARIVLNLHFYEAQVFEIVRVSYLLANRKCVVSETGHDTGLESPLKDGIRFANYDRLAAACLELLADADARSALAEKGFDAFAVQSQTPMLVRALSATIPGAIP